MIKKKSMKITELISKSDKTAFSFELLPPLKGNGVDSLYKSIDKLIEFDPAYINITTHRSEYIYKDLGGGMFQKSRLRRRPGTVAVAAAIKNKYGVNVVPHILCSGFTKEETEYVLIDLQFLGIYDLLILRGDKAKHDSSFVPDKDGHAHATDLIRQVNDFNNGIFIDGSPIAKLDSPFSFGVASYPEKHDEAPNMEDDIYWLKQKVELGAEYAVTQMFFDNSKYFSFVDKLRKEGVTVPVIPGIKPLTKLSQLTTLPKTFKIDLPEDFVREVRKCTNDEQASAVGVEWCISQCRELMKAGVPSIHFYSYSATDSIRKVAEAIY